MECKLTDNVTIKKIQYLKSLIFGNWTMVDIAYGRVSSEMKEWLISVKVHLKLI